MLFVTSTLAHAGSLPLIADIPAHPALWTVHSRSATAYLLGSIHLLPTNVRWRTPKLEAAMAASDVFVFEAPMDDSGKAATEEFMREHGALPPDVALPSLLDAQTLADYDKALALTHVPPDTLTHTRPWVAGLILEVALIGEEHYSPDSGVDRQVFALAHREGKTVRYFETVDRQFSLLLPRNPKLELAEFDATLKGLGTQADELGPLVDAWAHGNADEVGKLVNAELEADPAAKKTLLDNRTEAWAVQLNGMLAEHHTYFITVGAGHLAGPNGLSALLRARGYRVDGP